MPPPDPPLLLERISPFPSVLLLGPPLLPFLYLSRSAASSLTGKVSAPCFLPLCTFACPPCLHRSCFSHSGKGNGRPALPGTHPPRTVWTDPVSVDCEPSGQGPSTNTGADSRMSPLETEQGQQSEEPASPFSGRRDWWGHAYQIPYFPVEQCLG